MIKKEQHMINMDSICLNLIIIIKISMLISRMIFLQISFKISAHLVSEMMIMISSQIFLGGEEIKTNNKKKIITHSVDLDLVALVILEDLEADSEMMTFLIMDLDLVEILSFLAQVQAIWVVAEVLAKVFPQAQLLSKF